MSLPLIWSDRACLAIDLAVGYMVQRTDMAVVEEDIGLATSEVIVVVVVDGKAVVGSRVIVAALEEDFPDLDLDLQEAGHSKLVEAEVEVPSHLPFHWVVHRQFAHIRGDHDDETRT